MDYKNKIKTPNTPPVKDETGKTALKYILSNGSKNIVLWIRHDTSLDLKEIFEGMASTIETGGNIKHYLSDKSEDSILKFKLDQKKYLFFF